MSRRARRAASCAALVVAAAITCLAPASASARLPVIAYVEGGQFKLFDAEAGADVAAPPVAITTGTRWAMSKNGRYVFFLSGGLHLYDREIAAEVSLPGINVYATPAFLNVSDNGVVTFDNNVNAEPRVYDSRTGQFVTTGITAPSGHRQTAINGNGTLLATTCFMACVFDDGTGDVDPYLQNLTTQANVPMPGSDNNMRDEEDPCISADGNLVGYQLGEAGNAMKTNIVVYSRATGTLLGGGNLGLNTLNQNDAHCAFDESGDYVAFMNEVTGFQLFRLSDASLQSLPAGKKASFEITNTVNGVLSDPFTPTQKPASSTPGTTPAPARVCRKHKRKKKHHAASAKKKKKKGCKKKKKKKKRK